MTDAFCTSHLRLLCINDVYKPEKFALVKTMKPLYKGKGMTKCILPGDFVGGSLFASKFKGESMIKVANAVGFDYATLGNHGLNVYFCSLKRMICGCRI